jgi:toxin ParE1/3/4
VDEDIVALASYLLLENEDAARRFVEAVQKTLKDLSRMPGMGSRKEFSNSALSEVRSWWVEGFPNHLIYYLPLPDGIDVLAIMHGSRDVEPQLIRRV